MGWEVMNKSAEINKRRVRLILPIPPERKKGEIFFFENHRIQGVLSIAVVLARIKGHMISRAFITKQGFVVSYVPMVWFVKYPRSLDKSVCAYPLQRIN